jgi:hypothetical protein
MALTVGVERTSTPGFNLVPLLSETAGHLGYRMFDGEGLAFRVEIAPANGAIFSTTCSGRRRDVQEVSQLGISFTCVMKLFVDLIRVYLREIRCRRVRGSCVGGGVECREVFISVEIQW